MPKFDLKKITDQMHLVPPALYSRAAHRFDPYTKGYTVLNVSPKGEIINAISYDGQGRPTGYFINDDLWRLLKP